jgi:hypothetical protein
MVLDGVVVVVEWYETAGTFVNRERFGWLQVRVDLVIELIKNLGEIVHLSVGCEKVSSFDAQDVACTSNGTHHSPSPARTRGIAIALAESGRKKLVERSLSLCECFNDDEEDEEMEGVE